MEVYTYCANPWKFGGTSDIIKTSIEEYERVKIGRGYFGILFMNPVKLLWHISLEQGAIIGTSKSKAALLKRIRRDVETGDEKIMEQQIEKSINECNQAIEMEPIDFFDLFKSQ